MPNNQNNAAINQNANARERIGMKKSARSFESIIAAAKKQQKQLDAARKAWKEAKTPAAKSLAQKTGERAKKNLEALRQQWRATKAATSVPKKENSSAPTTGKKEILCSGSVFKTGSGNHYYVDTTFDLGAYHTADTKDKQEMVNKAIEGGAIHKVKNLSENYIFHQESVSSKAKDCSIPSVEEDEISSVGAESSDNDTATKEKIKNDAIAKEAMASRYKIALEEGETFVDEDGRKYEVLFSFEIAVYLVTPRAGQQLMIKAALENGDIRVAA